MESDDLGRLPLLVGSSVAIAPAVWVLIGLAVALFGLLPRAVAAVWGALAACYLAAFLGPLLGLPDWVIDISPFTHVPLLPAADFDAMPLLASHRGRRGVHCASGWSASAGGTSRVANVNCGWVGRWDAGGEGEFRAIWRRRRRWIARNDPSGISTCDPARPTAADCTK